MTKAILELLAEYWYVNAILAFLLISYWRDKELL